MQTRPTSGPSRASSVSRFRVESAGLMQARSIKVDELKAMIVSGRSTVDGQQSTAISSASLQQNIPNPFTNTTKIGYTLPQKFNSAQIVITDKNGKTLKTVNVSDSGK